VAIWLTVAGCPMRETITNRVRDAVGAVPGVREVRVELDVMSDDQRTELRRSLRGDAKEPTIPFSEPGNLTRVYCVASGKGGVGKSSVTANLAASMAARGLSVGVLDADIYGHSMPRMLGTSARPTKVDDMIMPPQAHGVKVISIGMFTQGNAAVTWRGPMLHRALQQFLADVFWGDLDVLLLDLPPGTGDVAISCAPADPECGDPGRHHPAAGRRRGGRAGRVDRAADPSAAGRRGGEHVLDGPARRLPDGGLRQRRRAGRVRLAVQGARRVGAVARQIPLDTRLRESGDSGTPLVLSAPDTAAAKALTGIAERLGTRARGLAGMSLNISPVRK